MNRQLTMVGAAAAIGLCLLAVHANAEAPRTAFVHLFEWPWTDVAQECERVLGPGGFAAVQVSPPQEHVRGDAWWTRYQPVSYKIESRSGNRREFQDMVERCRRVGVDVYAEAVINHMAAGESNTCGEGVAGSKYCKYDYPGVYSPEDFHDEKHCAKRVIEDVDYTRSANNVRNCELAGLADLITEDQCVRNTITEYLKDLMSLGVKGFHIDAAKYIPPGDLRAIISPTLTSDGQQCSNPYYVLEVHSGAGEVVTPELYRGLGDITEFKFGSAMRDHFRNRMGKTLSGLRTLGLNPGSRAMLRSNEAVTFIDTPDTQRDEHRDTSENVLRFKDQRLHTLATIYMLAVPYGYPKVMSSYDFSRSEDGPPRSRPLQGECGSNGWMCEHRTPEVLRMVQFRNLVGGQSQQTEWWDNGNNAIAFGRGDRGFVVVNRESFTMERLLQTSMAPGKYCDIISGNLEGGACTGRSVVVGADGQMFARVPGMAAFAFHAGSRVGAPDRCVTEYDRVFVRGTFNGWQPTDQMKCVAANTWELTVNFQGSENPRFKLDVFGEWSLHYGLQSSGSDRLVRFGGDIPAVSNGRVTIRFNDATNTISQTPVGARPSVETSSLGRVTAPQGCAAEGGRMMQTEIVCTVTETGRETGRATVQGGPGRESQQCGASRPVTNVVESGCIQPEVVQATQHAQSPANDCGCGGVAGSVSQRPVDSGRARVKPGLVVDSGRARVNADVVEPECVAPVTGSAPASQVVAGSHPTRQVVAGSYPTRQAVVDYGRGWDATESGGVVPPTNTNPSGCMHTYHTYETRPQQCQ